MFKTSIRHVQICRHLIRPLTAKRYVSSHNFFNRNIKPLFGLHGGKIEPSVDLSQIKFDPIVRVPSVFDYYKQFRPKVGFNKSHYPINKSMLSSKRLDYHSSIRHHRPDVGSMVEVQKDDGSVHLGIVISKQQGLFHEEMSSLSMIDAHGGNIKFKMEDVTFHLYGFLQQSCIEQPITLISKTSIAHILQYFINISLIAKYNNSALYTAAQAWFAKENSSVKVDIEEITKFTQTYSTVQQEEFLSYESLLFAAHLELSEDAVNWMTLKPKGNGHLDDGISKSITQFEYFSNSLHTCEHLELATKLSDDALKRVGFYFKDKIEGSEPNSSDSKPYIKHVIQLMKHYIIYPHHLFKERLIPVISAIASSTDFEVKDIYTILEDLEEFDEGSEIFETIESRLIPKLSPKFGSKTTFDYFQFMREPFEKIAYGLPSIHNTKISDLSISLEKANNSWFLQIHVLDVGSHISPDSKIVKLMKETVSSLNLSRNRSIPLIPDDIVNMLIFHNNSPGNNAISFNIEFPLIGSKGWEDAKLVSVELTSLENFKFVPLEEINDIIDTKVDFLSIFKSNKPENQTVLDSDDKSTLSSIFKLVEEWQIMRNNKHSLDFTFPYKKCIEQEDESLELSPKIPLDLDFLSFIRTEIGYIVSEYLSKYHDGTIPLLRRSQDILPPLNDSIEVETQKFSIPNYQGLKYEHFTLFPNVRGEVSLKKYISGSQFLNHEIVSTNHGNQHHKYGLNSGYVKFIDPLNNFEDLLNQWQLVIYLKKQLQSVTGYNYHINKRLESFTLKNPKDLLKTYKYEIEPVLKQNKQIEYWNDRYWKLQWLEEQRLREEWLIFQCTVTSPINPETKLCDAYCFDMDLQVEILVSGSDNDYVRIGDQLLCTKIIKLDYIESRLILSI